MIVPMRTCEGCGRSDKQVDLQRFVRLGDGLSPDLRRVAGGRGAYLHDSIGCRAAFAKRRGSIRSLRVTGSSEEREHLVAVLGGMV